MTIYQQAVVLVVRLHSGSQWFLSYLRAENVSEVTNATVPFKYICKSYRSFLKFLQSIVEIIKFECEVAVKYYIVSFFLQDFFLSLQVDREFRVLSALKSASFPVPNPYLYCGDISVIGTEFYIMEHVQVSDVQTIICCALIFY